VSSKQRVGTSAGNSGLAAFPPRALFGALEAFTGTAKPFRPAILAHGLPVFPAKFRLFCAIMLNQIDGETALWPD
jgi:hypothetical protein